MIYLFSLILGATVNAIRGGQHGKIRRYLERLSGIRHDRNGQIAVRLRWYQWIVNRLLDGKTINAVAFALAVALLPAVSYQGMADGVPHYMFQNVDWSTGFYAGLAMLAGAAPGWGDYIGAMGNWRKDSLSEWPPIDAIIERWYDEPVLWGFAGMTLRGALLGFLVALALHSVLPIVGGALMGCVYFVSVRAYQERGWPIAEWIFGGIFWLLCIVSVV